MKKNSFLVLIAIVGFGVSSCSYIKSFSEKQKEVEDASKSTIQINAKAEGKEAETKKAKKAKQDSVAKTVDETEEVKREQEIVGLIPSTNPEIRVRGSIRGRQDPFSAIAVKPTIEIKEETKIEENSSNNKTNRTRPKNIISTPTIETLETPEAVSPTELAENVLISGLVELGDRIKLIIQAPEEATSRYVDIGQYISNGQVLVKRIESGFPTPTVILEQSGIEVAKVIGQPREEASDEQAILPPPPPSTSKSISWLSNYLAEKSDNSITR